MPYDRKKTLIKVLWIAGEVLVAGTISYLTDYQAFLVLIPVLEGLRNWIKHRKDK